MRCNVNFESVFFAINNRKRERKHCYILYMYSLVVFSQANSYVDMSGIRMHTVAVRSEELKDSGQDLLQWVEYYLGPVAMYASANNTNKIQLTLPQIGELTEVGAKARQNQQNDLCTQQRLRSARASAQSDQSLRFHSVGSQGRKVFFMWTVNTLIRLGRCPDPPRLIWVFAGRTAGLQKTDFLPVQTDF